MIWVPLRNNQTTATMKDNEKKWFYCGILLIITVIVIFLFWPFLVNDKANRSKRDKLTHWHPNFNTYQAIQTTYAVSLNVSNCWVCTAIPTVHNGLMLETIPLGVNETWMSLVFEAANVNSKSKVALQLRSRKRGTVCFSKNGNTNKVGQSQCNVTIVHKCNGDNSGCVTNFTPIKKLVADPNFYEKMISVYNLLFLGMLEVDDLLNPINVTIKVKDCYFICGKKAYKWLPYEWSGSCFLGYLIPAIRHVEGLPQGKIRNARSLNKPINPVGKVDASWIYHHDLAHASSKGLSHMDLGDDVIAGAGIFPHYGAAKSIWELRKLSKLLETLSNATFSALELVTDELTAMRTVVLQNRMALDFTLAAKGGTCALIHEECCSFIPDNGHEIQSHLDLIQQISELAKPGPNPLTDFFQNIFGNWGSVLMNILIAICVGAIIFLLFGCCCIPCVKMIISGVISANKTKEYFSQYEKVQPAPESV